MDYDYDLNHDKYIVVALEEEFEIEFLDDEIIDMMNYRLIREITTSKLNNI